MSAAAQNQMPEVIEGRFCGPIKFISTPVAACPGRSMGEVAKNRFPQRPRQSPVESLGPA